MNIRDRFLELEKKCIHPSWKDFIWSFFGVIGNNFLNLSPPPQIFTKDGKKYLNLGAGSTKINSWTNADYYHFHSKFFKSAKKPDWMLDITKPFKCQSDYWDGVFIEHVNEHLSFSQNYDMLSEVYRVLKTDGHLRIIAPDLRRYIRYQELSLQYNKFKRYNSLPEAISNLTQNHSHKSVWDADLMEEVLLDIGFKKTEEVSFFHGKCKDILQDHENHKWESFYIEASK